VGAYVAGVFHLLTHAFFKAGLFLAAGSVMHAMSGSGDIMKMGGLRSKLKFTHIAFVAYWLAICGIVPFAGFFSKDEILAGAFSAHAEGWGPLYGKILWVVLSLAAVGTAFYMSRLYYLVFSGECRADEETKKHIHESPSSMTVPLLVLAAFTCVIGFIGLPHIGHLPNLLGDWLQASLVTATIETPHAAVVGGLCAGGALSEGACEAPHVGAGTIAGLLALALALGAAGIFIARGLYRRGLSETVAKATESGLGARLYDWSLNKLYVDELYDRIIVRPFRWSAQALFEVVDRFVIDLIFVNGSAAVVRGAGHVVRTVQNGQVHRYIAFFIAGAAAVFYFTKLSSPSLFGQGVDFTYAGDGQSITFKANLGAGPSAQGGTVRWDIDGNGQPDLRPGVAHTADPKDEDFLSDAELQVRAGAVGRSVTLWYTDPVFGDTVKVVKTIDNTANTASPAGGAK
jgi:NADH-quinone oxidoreductase subunit L